MKHNSMWRGIFQYFKNNSSNIPSIPKTIQHTSMIWCTYLHSFEKIHVCVFELQCENKTWQTDRQTDHVSISPVPGWRYCIEIPTVSIYTIWWNHSLAVSIYYMVKPQPREHIHVVSEWSFLNISKIRKKIQQHPINVKKTIQHTAMTWCTYLQSFEKIQLCVFKLVQKRNVTDRQTDGRAGGRFNISRPGAEGDNYTNKPLWYEKMGSSLKCTPYYITLASCCPLRAHPFTLTCDGIVKCFWK